ncbi:TPA: tail fiber assembly protein [Yersinia enterocolitica]|uniref:tail fiber assembly protein n=1 Tax=Yersinia enterocolitica TaxID=630 RepID=UPI0027F1B82D|nr:tail fiber assembly protein [Yersinia enterocolitica]EKN4820773.1 tail fiber assembly protein [Yersinia enterocolitica]EKN5163324.1 tail fiber assembly protein [Yersinia enterocolitica]EKN6042302.1 tail fiber assembly protein [Yersinia enterocolitica]EKN6076459.1 tail fiber assembly protein [Yersinia enterocolitica]
MTIEFDKDGYAVTAGDVTVYNAMPDTREYIGSSSEFINLGQGLPGHAYTDQPLKAKKGFAICRTQDNKNWEYVADHRGETRYSTITKAEVLIKELGEYPVNTTDIAPTQFDLWDGSTWIVDEAAKSAAAIQSATLKKAELKAVADSEIEWRQDAVEEGNPSEKEIADLAAWRKYRVELMRIDTSKAPDIEWTTSPE